MAPHTLAGLLSLHDTDRSPQRTHTSTKICVLSQNVFASQINDHMAPHHRISASAACQLNDTEQTVNDYMASHTTESVPVWQATLKVNTAIPDFTLVLSQVRENPGEKRLIQTYQRFHRYMHVKL